MPPLHQEIVLLSHQNANDRLLTDTFGQDVDVWFMTDNMNPTLLIHKALVDLQVTNLHLIGTVKDGFFRINNNIVLESHFPDYFPDYASEQPRRSIFFWNITPDNTHSIAAAYLDAINKRTRMAVHSSNRCATQPMTTHMDMHTIVS